MALSGNVSNRRLDLFDLHSTLRREPGDSVCVGGAPDTVSFLSPNRAIGLSRKSRPVQLAAFGEIVRLLRLSGSFAFLCVFYIFVEPCKLLV